MKPNIYSGMAREDYELKDTEQYDSNTGHPAR